MAVITSRVNPRIKEWMQLAKKAKDGRVLVEGTHLIAEALKSGAEIESIIYVPRRINQEIEGLLLTVEAAGIEQVEVSEDCYKKISQLNSGEGIAMVFNKTELNLQEFLSRCRKIVILENVQDPGNAGAIVRVAEATGMDGCLFLGGVSVSNGKFLRAAMGAAFRVPCVRSEPAEFYSQVESGCIDLFVTELDRNAISFMDADYGFSADKCVGICFGSEGRGVSDKLKNSARQNIYIPMAGEVESLNVAVAAGIVLYHIS